MKAFNLSVVILVVTLVGCMSQPPAPQVDVAAEEAALMAADTAFSESGADVDKHMSFYADGAVVLEPEMPIEQGKGAIRAGMTSLASAPGFELTWTPSSAHVSKSGDLGYTLGAYRLTMNDEAGNPTTSNGKYATVWEKQPDGQWKVVVDAPSSDAPATGSE